MGPNAPKVRRVLAVATDPKRLPVEQRAAWERLTRWGREAGIPLAALLGAYGLPDDMPLAEKMAEAERLTGLAEAALSA